MRKTFLIWIGSILLGTLAFGAVKTYIIAPKTVSSAKELLSIFFEARGSLPPLPSPVPYEEVLKQLAEGRMDFVANPNWAYFHRAGTYYLSNKSKLKNELTLPVQLVAYEDLLSETVVLLAISEATTNVVTLTMVNAPKFAEYDGTTSPESYLLKEFGPRRMVWSATLKSEADAWADLLATENEAVALSTASLIQTMSASEPVSGFCVVQDGTNLSVNLPPGFAGAEITLESCGSLVSAGWTNVWQTNVVDIGLMGIESPFISAALSGSGNAGSAFYRVSAESWVDSDEDSLDDVSEYERGTDYLDADTDDDGMPDGYEAAFGFDPMLFADGSDDPDADSLVSSNEYVLGTFPTIADSDSDGLPDGWEVQNGFDPLNAFDAANDDDRDGFSAAYEYVHGTGFDDSESVPTPTRYVSLTGSHIAPYSTLTTAATNIQAALDATTNDFEIIRVDAGTYSGPGNHDLQLPENPFMLFSEAPAADCVIECKTLTNGLYYYGSAFLCSDVENGFTVLRNLTFKDGHAIASLHCSKSKLLIDNCLLTDHVDRDGIAFLVESNSCLVMRDTIVSYFETREDYSQSFMRVDDSAVKMQRCDIFHSCEGVTLSGTSSLRGSSTRIQCIASNKTGSVGIMVAGDDCEISGMAVDGNETGIRCVLFPGVACIQNCVVLNNNKGVDVLWASSPVLLKHCTIIDNGVGIYASDAIVQNSILWGNGTQFSSSNILASSSCVQGSWPGTNNILTDPLLVQEYNLASSSPCLNSISDFDLDRDVDGYERDALPDMGAAEYINLEADSDGDGLPDWWEHRYGLSAVSSDERNGASGDFDGDGLSNAYEYSLQSSPAYANSVQAAFPAIQTRSTEVEMPKFGWKDFDPADPLQIFLQKSGQYERDYSVSRSESNSWFNASEEISRLKMQEYSRFGTLTTNYNGTYLYSEEGLSTGGDGSEITWAETKTGTCQPDGTFFGTEISWIDFPDDGLGPQHSTNTFEQTVNPPAVTTTNSPTERTSGIVSNESGYDVFTETLAVEHTTSLMVSNAQRLVSHTVSIPESVGPVGPWGEGRRYSFENKDWEIVPAEQTAIRDLATNETSILLRKVDCRFVVRGTPGVVYKIAPSRLFTPEDGSPPQSTPLDSITVLGTGEKQIITGHDIHLDPPSEEGVIEITTHFAGLIPDYNRDGTIDNSDRIQALSGDPYRFWINDDDDDPDSEVKGNDFPGQDSSTADYAEWHIDGMRDLIDFFPVKIELDDLLCDTNRYSYYLKNEDQAVNFVYTDLQSTDVNRYLADPVFAQTMLSASRTMFSHYIGFGAGEIADDETLAQLQEFGETVLIFEGRKFSSAPLVLEVREKVSGNVVASAELPLSLDSVENMYRFKNLRADGEGRKDSLKEPANWPDKPSSGDFVFVHGYNVSEEDGDATHAEVFKRMVQSGFDGKFWGVSWYGDPPAIANAHYHNAVVEAFAVASEFRVFLMSFDSPPDLAAHSLGNGVVGIALNDTPGTTQLIDHYFALDAAMSLEAYGDTATSTNMVCGELFALMEIELVPSFEFECSWREYPDDVWASEWYRLFDTSDLRSTLTWRNRMEHAVDHVASAYNFYSSTEEVLRVDENCRSYWSTLQNWRFSWPPVDGGYYAWQIQEWYKGTASAVPSSLAGGSSEQAGWGVVDDNASVHMSDNKLESPICVSNQLATNAVAYKDNLKSDPFFKHEPEILFTTNGSSFVSDFVMNQSAHLDYTPDSVGYVQVRDWLLAKGFPARTRPMGASFISPATGWISINMASDDSDDNGLMLHGWPRANRYIDITGSERLEWRHGDFKDVAYPYVQSLYKMWVDICE